MATIVILGHHILMTFHTILTHSNHLYMNACLNFLCKKTSIVRLEVTCIMNINIIVNDRKLTSANFANLEAAGEI